MIDNYSYLAEYYREVPSNEVAPTSVAELEQIMYQSKNIEGLVLAADREFNLKVRVGDFTGTVPRSEVSCTLGEDGLPRPVVSMVKVNKTILVKVKDIIRESPENVRLELSAKEVELEAKKWLFERQVGDVIPGIVRNIESYGVFVDIGAGFTGLLHIEDISVNRIKHPSERFKVGDKIAVSIKKLNYETGQVQLSHKELLGTWEDNVKEFEENSTVVGIVRGKIQNGVFIELKPNLAGLAEYRPDLEYGQVVTVFIKRIVPEKHKIKLAVVSPKVESRTNNVKPFPKLPEALTDQGSFDQSKKPLNPAANSIQEIKDIREISHGKKLSAYVRAIIGQIIY